MLSRECATSSCDVIIDTLQVQKKTVPQIASLKNSENPLTVGKGMGNKNLQFF